MSLFHRLDKAGEAVSQTAKNKTNETGQHASRYRVDE